MSKTTNLKKVAIIGFGLMGAQIAQVFAQAGYQVSAYDVSEEQLYSGLELVKTGRYGLQANVAKGRMSQEESNKVISRIILAKRMEDALFDADIVLEAAIEDPKIKREILESANRFSRPDTILATNTSTLSISKLSDHFPPDVRGRILGMHFFNPPQVMKLVEIVRTRETNPDIVSQVQDLALKLKKTPITVLDIPGFVANRIGISVFAEASSLLEKGVASVRDIDLAMRLGYGYPMGPFELGDLVGLDARLRNMEALYKETQDEKFKPPNILRKLVAAGYIGDQKTKKSSKGGYYEYYNLKRANEEG